MWSQLQLTSHPGLKAQVYVVCNTKIKPVGVLFEEEPNVPMRLQVNLMEARNLAVWGFPWQSNPYCRLSLGSQVMRSRKDDATSHRGSHKAPVWNQEFHFLVSDTTTQVRQLAA